MSQIQKMGLLTIFLMPLDTFVLNLFVIKISPFRISFLFLLTLFTLQILKTGKVQRSIYNKWIVLYSISSVLAYLLSTNKEWASGLMMNDLMGMAIVFIFINIYRAEDAVKIYNTILKSMIFPILITLYEYFLFFILDKRMTGIKGINIFNILILNVSPEQIVANRAAGLPRLRYPFYTSPAFALSVSIGLIILSFMLLYKSKKSNLKNIIFIGLLLIMVVGALSRSTIVALVITGIMLSFIGIGTYKVQAPGIRKRIFITSFIISIIMAIVFITEPISSISVLKQRLSELFSVEFLEHRHYLVRLESLHIWLSSVKNFLVGIGSGSGIYMTGKYTYLPPHFLSPYFTILAERGLIGVFSIISIYFVVLRKSYRRMRLTSEFEYASYFYTLLFVMIAFLFYELRAILSVWTILALGCVLTNTKKRSIRGDKYE